MPEHRPDLGLQRNLGDAFSELVRRLFPHHTAKSAARHFNLEFVTAQNAVKGKASERTITKAVHAEGEEAWALWDALGELLIGESRDTYEERKIRQIIESTENAKQRTFARLERRAALGAGSAFMDALGDRQAS